MNILSKTRVLSPGLWALIGVLMFSTAACDSSEDDGTRLQIRLTDAPLDSVLEANVTIQRIELIDSSGQTIVLSDEEQPFDLLQLQNGVTADLASVSLENGVYNQMRVVVGEDASLLMTDSTIQDLKIPSGSTSGITINNLPEVVLADSIDQVEITLDFDVEESFIDAGNSGMFIFRPVIKPLSFMIDGVEQQMPTDSTQTG